MAVAATAMAIDMTLQHCSLLKNILRRKEPKRARKSEIKAETSWKWQLQIIIIIVIMYFWFVAEPFNRFATRTNLFAIVVCIFRIKLKCEDANKRKKKRNAETIFFIAVVYGHRQGDSRSFQLNKGHAKGTLARAFRLRLRTHSMHLRQHRIVLYRT